MSELAMCWGEILKAVMHAELGAGCRGLSLALRHHCLCCCLYQILLLVVGLCLLEPGGGLHEVHVFLEFNFLCMKHLEKHSNR